MNKSSASSNHQPVFSAQLEPDELEKIFKRIDENLEVWSTLQTRSANEGIGVIELEPPSLSQQLNLNWDLKDAEQWHTLLYFVGGWSIPDIVKRLFNIPLKLFGAKQILFNQRVLHILKNIDGELQNLRASAYYQFRLINEINQINVDLSNLKKEYQMVLKRQEELNSLIEKLTNENQKLRDELRRAEEKF